MKKKVAHKAEQTKNNVNPDIEAARELLRPREIDLHRVPRWMAKRLRAYCRMHSLEHGGIVELALQYAAGDVIDRFGIRHGNYICDASRVLDHWGISKIYDKLDRGETTNERFVSEPYHFDEASALFWTAFCKVLGEMNWYIDANAWWFPGSTVRVVVYEQLEAV